MVLHFGLALERRLKVNRKMAYWNLINKDKW